jgi:hypothetical protein
VLLIIGIAIVIIPNFFQPTNVPVPQKGSPVSFNESINCFINIDQISSNENFIFLLDKYDGYLRVFDINGNYIKTFAFFDSPNGIWQMALFEDLLYVSAYDSDLYFIQNGEFVEYVDYIYGDESMRIFNSIDFSQQSKKYEARRGGVWDVSGDEDRLIIPIKDYNTFLSNKASRLTMTIFICILIQLVRFMPQKKGKLNNSYSLIKDDDPSE